MPGEPTPPASTGRRWVTARRQGLRFMGRRRHGTASVAGDPLAAFANLFPLAAAIAVGLVLALLTGLGLEGLLTADSLTLVVNPGNDDMAVVVREGGVVRRVEGSGAVAGVGTLVGSFYRLADGTVIYVPAGQKPPPGATQWPGTAPTPGATPTASPTPWMTASPTPGPTASATAPATAPPTARPTAAATVIPRPQKRGPSPTPATR